jgi:hypothetical protein
MKAAYITRVAALALTLATTVSCTDSVRQGTGSTFLIIDRMAAANGNTPNQFGESLMSDVVTVVNGTPTIFNDLGQVTLSLGEKDPGRVTSPTQNTSITVERYHVRFVRADGRNTPGLDVPQPFDGAFTARVDRATATTVSFPLVRHVAKQEAPLGALAGSPVIITTIAEITFYGRDQVGHEVSATGRITVEFGNFAD